MRFRSSLVCLLWLGLFSGKAGATLPIRTQDFTTDPGWIALGSSANSNSFGFQPQSALAGGSIGEAGGTFTRSDFNRAYADNNLGGIVTLDEPFEASGKFDFTSKNRPDFGQPLWLGHFGLEGGTFAAGNKAGLFFNNGASESELSWGVGVMLIGQGDAQTIQSVLALNADRTWSYSWDPTGGVHGMGRLTGALSGPGGGAKFVDLTAEQRGIGVQLDSFGFAGHFPSPPNPNSTFFATMYVDDVRYSVVPEPASWLPLIGLVVWMISICLFRRRRRQGLQSI